MKRSFDQLPSLAVNVGFGLASRFGGRLLVFLYGVLAARFLGPETFGLFSIGLVLFRVLEVVLPLGFDVGIIKYGAGMAEPKSGFLKGMLGYSFAGSLGFSILLGFCLYFFAPWFSGEVLNKDSLVNVFQFFAFSLPLASMMVLCSSAITILRGIRYAVFIQDFGQPVVAVMLLVASHFYGAGLDGALISHLASYGIAGVTALLFLRGILPMFTNSTVIAIPPNSEYYMFSMASASTVFLSTLMLWSDRLLLAYYAPAYEVGIYQAASQLSVVFAVILSGLNRIFIPMFAELRNSGDSQGLREAYRVGTKWAISLGLPLIVFLFVNGEKTLQTLYGVEYGLGATILLILLMGQLINLLTGPVGALLTIGGYQNLSVALSGAALMMNITAGVLLIPRFGVLGAASAASIATGFLYLSLFLVAFRKIKVALFDRRYVKLILAGGICLASGMIVKSLWNMSMAGLALQFGLVITIFVAVLWVQGFEPEDQALLSAFKNPIMRMLGKGK